MKLSAFMSMKLHLHRAKKLKHLLSKKSISLTRHYMTEWKETIYLNNIQHAQKTIDSLPSQIEKNILYDIGGEVQRILEDNIHIKLTDNTSFYGEVDSMLKVIIERVKEIQGQHTLSLFDSTESMQQIKTWTADGTDGVNNFKKEIMFENELVDSVHIKVGFINIVMVDF